MSDQLDTSVVKYEAAYQDAKAARNLVLITEHREKKAKGEQCFNFAFGQSPFPVPQIAINSLAKYAAENLYENVAGVQRLREKVIDVHPKNDLYTPERVIISPGCKEGIWLLMHVAHMPIYLVSPTWLTYEIQCQTNRKQYSWLKTTEKTQFKVTPEMLRETCTQPGILIFVCPDNPTGCVYSNEELSELATVCREKNIIVVSDEIYGVLNFDTKPGHSYPSFGSVYPEGTIISSGLSKWASLGGWRLGYQIYPTTLDGLFQRVKAAASFSYSCVCAPVQYAGIDVLDTITNDQRPDFLKKSTIVLCAVAEWCKDELRKVGVRVYGAGSGFYLLPDFEVVRSEKIRNGTDLANALMADCAICMVEAGPVFGRPALELTTRFCYIDFDGKKALDFDLEPGSGDLSAREYLHKFVPNLETFVMQRAPNQLEGTNILTSWVKANSK